MASETNMPHIGWSSHVYPLDAADVARLPDYDGPAIPEAALPPDNVIVYIRPDGPDVLLRGRETIAAAMCSDPSGTVPVRIAFKPSVAKWNLAATIVRVLRNRYRYHAGQPAEARQRRPQGADGKAREKPERTRI